MKHAPHFSVKLVSFFFLIAGTLLFVGFIGSAIELAQVDYHIYLVYIFLSSLCFLVSYGLYSHKQWALYIAYAIGFYLIINFFLNISTSFTADLFIAGIPILLIVLGALYMLFRKRDHFIH